MPYFFRLLDALTVVLAGVISIYLKAFIDAPIVVNEWSNYIAVIGFGALIYVLSWGDLYRSWRGIAMMIMLRGVLTRWTVTSGLMVMGIFLFKSSDEISRLWFLLWLFSGVLLLIIERWLVYFSLRAIRNSGYNLRHVVIVGSGKVATQLIERARNTAWAGYQISRHFPLVDLDELEKLENANIDEVWLALPLTEKSVIEKALFGLRHCAASIRFVPDLFSFRLINHEAIEIIGMPMYNISATPLVGFNQWIKWLEDKILSTVILILISPLAICLAIGVKLSSPGPVFYRQERVGINNRKFMMLKFRSMPVDIEQNGVKWGGSLGKTTNKFGQFIRKTSLDELPQFINVLMGDMSIVGPRPERPIFVEEFKEKIPDYMKKHLVKAGITGWAQVHGWRGDTNLKERIEHDIYYIENFSLFLDLKIIFMTIYKGFINKNAY